jgi:hypothetical protein
VTVEAQGDAIRVEIGGRDLVLDLDGARGRTAARMIAVAAADLVLPELPSGAPPPAVAIERAAVAPPPRPLRLALIGQIGSEEATRAAATIGGELASSGPRLALEVGIAGGRAAAHGVSLLGVPVRAGVALGDTTAVRVGAVAMPFFVDGGGDHRGVLVGGAIAGQGRVRVGAHELVYQVGADVFANQVEYRWTGAPVMTTPRVALWAGLGVTWEVPR